MGDVPNIPVLMRCPDLAGTPHHALPQGHALRTYRPGDEQAWIDIHRAADPYNTASLELFESQFGAHREDLPRRQFYLLGPAGEPIGTATAWFGRPPGGAAIGRVHWVAILPSHQGRGLAKPLLSAVCRRLLQLGHREAYLTTSTARVPAINLYFRFGFLPDLDSTPCQDAWRLLLDRNPEGQGGLRPELAAWLRAHLPQRARA